MDNQFDNNYYDFEPQKPLTEKPDSITVDAESPENEPSVYDPQRPGEGPVRPVAHNDDRGFDPIRRTAVYSENGFSAPQPPQPPRPQYGGYYNQPPQYYPQTGQYYAPQPQPFYPQPQQYAVPPVPPAPSVQPVAEPVPPAEEPPKPVNSKPNTVLIVIIIVLSVLLAASTFGIVGYSVYISDNNKKDDNKSRQSSSIFEIDGNDHDDDNGEKSFGERGEFSVPETPSTTAPVHDESDFSDKIDKNYSGMVLNDKPADAANNNSYNAEHAFSQASDSVVSVLCFADKTDDNSNVTSQGSGIVLSSDGYIITNAHVIGNSKTAYAIKVVTADDKEYKAGVVGFDSRTDIALLKLVDASGLKAATFGDSGKITLGEDIIVIGNPGGIEYKNSMTKGVVSAINRDASSKSIVKYIQTDAAINPGNSGGPAVNMYGQVIGIASAKIVDEKYEGMGFCIPSAQVKEIIDTLMKNSYVDGRVRIGITGVAVTSLQAQYYGVPLGIVVYSVQEGGPCDGTGIKEDDIITALDGKPIKSFADIYQALEKYKDGDKVKLKFYRVSDDEDHEIEITLQADK